VTPNSPTSSTNPIDSANSRQKQRQLLREQCEREDLVMFINTCFAATNQNEFYNDGFSETVSVAFLHEYVLHNYRTVYARSLAANINHFNQAVIIVNLLAAGAPSDLHLRREENELITVALRRLPANRAFTLLQQLSHRQINNRRSRAIAKCYLKQRPEPAFDAVKYRRQYRAIVRHTHNDVGDDFSRFLFNYKQQTSFTTPLFEVFRKAHYAQSAVYELPYTIAESLAARHNINRAEFLRKIEHKLTRTERLRLQNAAAKAAGKPVTIAFDPKTASLTRLVIYVLSLSISEKTERADEFHTMLCAAAQREVSGLTEKFGKVALLADCSRSSSGSREKARRPLAVAIAAAYLLEAASTSLHVFWAPQPSLSSTTGKDYAFLIPAKGQTALAAPLIDALESEPQLLVIVSDGWENDPPLTVAGVVQAARAKIPGVDKINIVHANPVFDPGHFSPKPLSSHIATVGLRDAEDIIVMIEFAAFASGVRDLAALEAYLYQCSQRLRSNA